MTHHRSTSPITVQVHLYIARQPELVFDYFADLRNEPNYNGQVRDIDKTSPGRITKGTTFEGWHRGIGPVTWRLSEYQRPHHVVIEGQAGKGSYRWVGDFKAKGSGTWMDGRMEWLPPPLWQFLKPVLKLVLKWNAHRSFRRMADVLQRSDHRNKNVLSR